MVVTKALRPDEVTNGREDQVLGSPMERNWAEVEEPTKEVEGR